MHKIRGDIVMATIHFYKMDYLTKTSYINSTTGQLEYNTKYYLLDKFEKDFKDIVEDNIESKCLLIEEAPEWCLLEIIECGKNIATPVKCENIREADYIFARIGRKKDINELQRRNPTNFKSKDIDKDVDEDIEVFTYFYMIFERAEGKVSIIYLTSLSAPGIRQLDELMTKYSLDSKKRTLISPIITRDVSNVLKSKDIVNAYSYKIAVPTDKILGLNGIGLNEEAYDNLENVKTTEVVITITAERNKNLFKDKGKIAKLTDKIYKTSGSKVKDCLAKAKNSNGTLIPYHFLDNEFIEKAKFKYTSEDGELRVKEIKEELLGKYLLHRDELLEYMK